MEEQGNKRKKETVNEKMIIDLGNFWTFTLNVISWPVLQVGISLICFKIPDRYFRHDSFLYRTRPWEKSGNFYEKVFKVKKWKHLLPDGSAVVKSGFKKRKLVLSERQYFEKFRVETCRAEITHILQILPFPLFIIWNPWWAFLIMIFYSLAVNIPCIIVQRYNRPRLSRVLK